jgi:hypothetical protein
MIFDSKPLFLRHKSTSARLCPNYSFETENPRVGGSIPPLATIKIPVLTEHIGDGMDPPAFPSAEVAGRSLHRGIPLEEEQRWLSQRR